jgi:kynurenine formamidase
MYAELAASFIHGGGWRDPEIDSLTFHPAVTALEDSSVRDSIAGFASINYRLSPYPSHPQKPSSPDDLSRNAHYPAHLQDVEHALLYLEDQYHISGRYLLVGHSAGATMAFELHNNSAHNVPTPAGVLGVSGIYHFEAFVKAHSDIPLYQEFMDNAFPDRATWEMAAPYTNRESDFATWEHAKAVIIAHSNQDELIEKEQASFMLERARLTPHYKEKVHYLEATGLHDEIWQNGSILAGIITKSIKLLQPGIYW